MVEGCLKKLNAEANVDDNELCANSYSSEEEVELQSIKYYNYDNENNIDDEEDDDMSKRWRVLMQPMSTISVACTLGPKGRIFRVDDSFASLLSYCSMKELLGTKINKVIPNIDLSKEDEMQHLCALGVRGNSIPLNVRISPERDANSQAVLLYDLKIRALSSGNGVVTLTDVGMLHSFNDNFLEALIGKKLKDEAKNKFFFISDIIPDFHLYIKSPSYSVNAILERNAAQTNSSSILPPLERNGFSLPSAVDLFPVEDQAKFIDAQLSSLKIYDIFGVKLNDSFTSSMGHCSDFPSTSMLDENSDSEKVFENYDPDCISGDAIREGSFFGLARHSDNLFIAVKFDVRRLKSIESAYWAVCIGFDSHEDYGLFKDSTFIDSTLIAQISCDKESNENDIEDEQNEKIVDCAENTDKESSDAVCGEYSELYETFHLIGNGAFGSVKLAARKDSGLLAVTKFICKSKVHPECWIESPKHGYRMIPIELHLLETLSHPHIVKLLDVFENDIFYQLVMEKLGCGMDLFEFIDHHPQIDEPLISYIFRQVVDAVAYLHTNNIVHRDIKDENVIIDQNFSCKLIDFGSAAYFGKDIVFTTFCGTLEYCSPEVLAGKRYSGPELEMWSLGILLYTLIFFENPFRSRHEVINSEISDILDVSEDLYDLIIRLLQKDPVFRAKVHEINRHKWVVQHVNIREYKFQQILESCERAQFDPPVFVSDIRGPVKNASCSALIMNIADCRQEQNKVFA